MSQRTPVQRRLCCFVVNGMYQCMQCKDRKRRSAKITKRSARDYIRDLVGNEPENRAINENNEGQRAYKER